MDIKEVIKEVHSANVFTKELTNKFTIKKESTKDVEKAQEFIRYYKSKGYTTKKQSVSGLGMFYCTAIKEKLV